MANRAIVFVDAKTLADFLACRGQRFQPCVHVMSDAPEDLRIINIIHDLNYQRRDRFAFICESEEFPKVPPGGQIPIQEINYHVERGMR